MNMPILVSSRAYFDRLFPEKFISAPLLKKYELKIVKSRKKIKKSIYRKIFNLHHMQRITLLRQ